MSVVIKLNSQGARVGLVHKIDDQGYDRPQRNYERRSMANKGCYRQAITLLAAHGPLDAIELELLLNKKRQAIYTCMRFLIMKGAVRRVGERRDLPGKPVGVFAAASTSEHAGSPSFG